ncbi:MAG TPA: FHA domain-containing protein [Tepidisphaeraceae bacterium]|jgi:pSer/pThr/pTyr-binding forkhead associated (FHA) protein
MNVVLIMVRDNGEQRSFALTRDTTLIGRREDADFRIPLTDVSRKHCRLIKDGNVLILEDLGSSNGTIRNGQRVKECELEPGDTIQIGPVRFIVQIDGHPGDNELGGTPRARSAAPTGTATGTRVAPPPPPPSFDSSTFDLISPVGDSIADAQPPASSKV